MTFKATILLPFNNEGVNSTLVESDFMFNFIFNFNIDPKKWYKLNFNAHFEVEVEVEPKF